MIAGLTGIHDRDLRGAPRAPAAVSRFLAFAGDHAVLVAHNARFDLAFLDREVELLSGRRLAAPVVDTVGLARRLLAGRIPRVGLASLAHFFGTSVRPCHRALPDAQATAEILVSLIGLAQERGARTVADLVDLAAPRRRRVYDKRSLVFGAPTRPGVYVFRGAGGEPLYVGRARDLRARLRSYFRSERQRPAVEAALAAVDRVEWTRARLRGGGGARGAPPDPGAAPAGERPREAGRPRASTCGRAASGSSSPRSRARSARSAAGGAPSVPRARSTGRPRTSSSRLTAGGPLPRLRARLRDLSECLRYEDAGRLRDRIRALESVIRELAALERLRAAEVCLLTPGSQAGLHAERSSSPTAELPTCASLPRAPERRSRCAPGIAAVRAAEPSLAPEDAEELLLLGSFLRRPPPELTVVPVDEGQILAALRVPRTEVA